MPDRVIHVVERILQLCKECMACMPLLFAKPSSAMPKNVNRIRIAEVVIGSIITSIIIGVFAQYTAIVILEQKTKFFEKRVEETITEIKDTQEEFEDFEKEMRSYHIGNDKHWEDLNRMIKEEQWLRSRTQ